MNSGLPYTILKPCGLTNGPAGQATIATFHNDQNKTLCCGNGSIARKDMARLIDSAFKHPSVSSRLRFNLCSYAGQPTPDSGLVEVLQHALYPWETQRPRGDV